MKPFSLVGECAEKSELVGRLVGRGLQLSTIKRVSDAVDLERQDSGTWKHRAAGAAEVMIASASRLALLREMPSDTIKPEVSDPLARMAPLDIVPLDGFRRSNYLKMEVVRLGHGHVLLALDDPTVLAITSDAPISANVPRLALLDIGALADFVPRSHMPNATSSSSGSISVSSQVAPAFGVNNCTTGKKSCSAWPAALRAAFALPFASSRVRWAGLGET